MTLIVGGFSLQERETRNLRRALKADLNRLWSREARHVFMWDRVLKAIGVSAGVVLGLATIWGMVGMIVVFSTYPSDLPYAQKVLPLFQVCYPPFAVWGISFVTGCILMLVEDSVWGRLLDVAEKNWGVEMDYRRLVGSIIYTDGAGSYEVDGPLPVRMIDPDCIHPDLTATRAFLAEHHPAKPTGK